MIKLNLHCGTNPRSDCQNWDNREQVSQNVKDVNFAQNYNEITIDPITEKADEIIVNEGGLESISKENLNSTLLQWANLLKDGGELIIRFDDMRHVMTNYIMDHISIQEMESVIKTYKSLYEMHTVRMALINAGFKIQTENCHDRLGIIHARK